LQEALALLEAAEKGIEGLYDLDENASPKTINLTSLGEIRRIGLGLYTLDGDTLKLCMSIDPNKGAERPTEFSSNGRERRAHRVLLQWRRLSDTERILGTWLGVAAEADGQALPQELIDAIRPTMTFTPDKLIALPGMDKVFAFLDTVARRGLLPKEATTFLE